MLIYEKKPDFICIITFIQTQTFYKNQSVLQMQVTQKPVQLL